MSKNILDATRSRFCVIRRISLDYNNKIFKSSTCMWWADIFFLLFECWHRHTSVQFKRVYTSNECNHTEWKLCRNYFFWMPIEYDFAMVTSLEMDAFNGIWRWFELQFMVLILKRVTNTINPKDKYWYNFILNIELYVSQNLYRVGENTNQNSKYVAATVKNSNVKVTAFLFISQSNILCIESCTESK